MSKLFLILQLLAEIVVRILRPRRKGKHTRKDEDETQSEEENQN